ncbi:MAG: hypothetical protein ACT4PW_11190 [Acidimicrobiia bacterium]
MTVGCSEPGRSAGAFCDELKRGDDPMALFGRYDPAAPDDGRGALDQAVDRLAALERRAPDAVAGPAQVLVDAARELVAALDARAPGPGPDDGDRTTPTSPDLDGDAIVAASTAFRRFALDQCGVSLDHASGPAPTEATDPG